MQTRSAGSVTTAMGMLLATATTGRWRVWPGAAVATAQVCLTWEFLIALLHGQSHFLLSLRAAAGWLLTKGSLAAVFFATWAALAQFLVVLGMAALGVRRRWLAAAVVLIVAGFALIVLFAGGLAARCGRRRAVRPHSAPKWAFPLSEVVFDVFAGGGVVVWSSRSGGFGRRRPARTLFLLLWLGLEALAYFPLTPFPATRRVLGPLVVLTLLVGRLAARTAGAAGAAHRLGAGGVRRGIAGWRTSPWTRARRGPRNGGRSGRRRGSAPGRRGPRLVRRPLRVSILCRVS